MLNQIYNAQYIVAHVYLVKNSNSSKHHIPYNEVWKHIIYFALQFLKSTDLA